MGGPVDGKATRGGGAAAARAERNARIWTRSIEGWSQAEIAKAEGLTQARICQLITEAAKAITRPPAEALIAQENAKLTAREQDCLRVLRARHVLVRGDGVVLQYVINDDGKVELNPATGEPMMRELEDDAPVLSAVATLLKIYERRAKLNGYDAPTKVEQTTYDYRVNGVEVVDGAPGKLA
jgi:hypothetical protein